MNEQMKKAGRDISLKMAVTMSFCMSLIGNLSSGHFTIPGFLVSFVLSFLISLAIGLLIPMGRVSGAVCKKAGLKRGSLGARLMESFVSNLIYTPLMTLVMVFFAYNMAMRASGGMAALNFGQMFLHSLIICFVAGYIVIFIVQPIFMRQAMKKYGIDRPE
jgi:hypothetical protein